MAHCIGSAGLGSSCWLANHAIVLVADYTPPGPQFRRCRFEEIADGTFSWNRLAYGMSPDVLGWFREWPESHPELWPH
jgi:hypothetical protein